MNHAGMGWLFKSLAAGTVVFGLVAACGSSSNDAPGCNASPWQCATGTTCWPECLCTSGNCTLSNCTLQFTCLTSGQLSLGDSCSLSVGSSTAVCGDGLTCVSFADAGPGSCRPYCGPNQGCAPGDQCVELSVSAGKSSATERVCVPPAIVIDAGLMVVDTGTSSGGPPSDGSLFDLNQDGQADATVMMQ